MSYLVGDPPRDDVACPELTFTIRGRWWRIFAGVTFRSERFRDRRFYGHRLLAVRLWSWRIVGIQTRLSDEIDRPGLRFRRR